MHKSRASTDSHSGTAGDSHPDPNPSGHAHSYSTAHISNAPSSYADYHPCAHTYGYSNADSPTHQNADGNSSADTASELHCQRGC